MKDKIVKGIMITGTSSLMCQLVTWLSTFVVARILNPDDYGLVGMAGVYIGVTEYLNELGVGSAIIQRQDLNEDDVRGLYSIAILVGAFMTGVSVLIAPLISSFFKEPRLIAILQVLSITFVISSAKSVQRNLMVRDMAFACLAKVDVMCGVLTSIVALFCAVKGFGAWTLVIQYLSMNILGFLGSFYYERRLPGRISDWSKLREMLSFGLGIMFFNFFRYINRNIDYLIIGKLLGKSLLGNYSLAQTLANKPFEKMLPVFDQVFIPFFSKIQSDKQQVKKCFIRIVSVELIVFAPIFVLLAIAADDIIVTLLGGKWVGSVLPMQLFSMLGFCKYIENRISVILTSQGCAKSQVYYTSSLSLVMACSVTILAYLFGIKGVITAWAICYPIVLSIYLAYFLKFINIRFFDFLSAFKMPVITSTIMSIFVYSIEIINIDSSLIRLIAKLSTAVIVYIIANLLINRDAVNDILETIKNRKQGVAAS